MYFGDGCRSTPHTVTAHLRRKLCGVRRYFLKKVATVYSIIQIIEFRSSVATGV